MCESVTGVYLWCIHDFMVFEGKTAGFSECNVFLWALLGLGFYSFEVGGVFLQDLRLGQSLDDISSFVSCWYHRDRIVQGLLLVEKHGVGLPKTYIFVPFFSIILSALLLALAAFDRRLPLQAVSIWPPAVVNLCICSQVLCQVCRANSSSQL